MWLTSHDPPGAAPAWLERLQTDKGRPLAQLRGRPAPVDKIWAGNLSGDDEYLCDGQLALVAARLDARRRRRLAIRRADTKPRPVVRQIELAVERAIDCIEPTTWTAGPHDHPALTVASSDFATIVLDAERFRAVKAATRADMIRSPRRWGPIALFRDRRPVALMLPVAMRLFCTSCGSPRLWLNGWPKLVCGDCGETFTPQPYAPGRRKIPVELCPDCGSPGSLNRTRKRKRGISRDWRCDNPSCARSFWAVRYD